LSDTPAPKPELEAGAREGVLRELSASKGSAAEASKKDVGQGALISKTLASAKDAFEEEEGDGRKAVVVTEVAPENSGAPLPDPETKPARPSVPPRPGLTTTAARGSPMRTTGPAATIPSAVPRPNSTPPLAGTSAPVAVPKAPPVPTVVQAAPPPAVTQVALPPAVAPPPAAPPAIAPLAAPAPIVASPNAADRGATATTAATPQDPSEGPTIAAMPIITLGTSSAREKDAVSVISSGIRRSSIPPPAPVDPKPVARSGDPATRAGDPVGAPLSGLSKLRVPFDSLVETAEPPPAALKSDSDVAGPPPGTAVAAGTDDRATGPSIDVSVEEVDEPAEFDVDDATESEPPPDTEVVSERETLRADDVITSEGDDTPIEPIATIPRPAGYPDDIDGQQPSARIDRGAEGPATERGVLAMPEFVTARTAASTAGPNDDTQPEGIRARASEPPPEVDPEDMEIHEPAPASADALARKGDGKKPPPRVPQPPIQTRGAALAAAVQAQRAEEPTSGAKRARYWWDELFGDDFLRTMDRFSAAQIKTEVNFIEESLGVQKGGVVLDLACGAGKHAVEMAARGYNVVGYDLSLAMLARAADEAHDRKQKLNFLHGDMRDMGFEEMFDGIYCWSTSFGYFDDEKNQLVAQRIHRALRQGGMLLLDLANRDFVTQRQPSLVWFEGDGCVCMDEMRVDFITSRLKVKRMVILDDGRSRELDYSIRLYTLHELGRMLHDVGFKVTDVSGHPATPGVFMGADSPRLIVCAERA
jgi:SAM-dependent methyltransferase